jgi:competence protein ComEA
MQTELPADRLHRRLGVTGEPEPDSAKAADATSALSRWLPTSPDTRTGWLAAVRADPGRAGLFALGAVGVIAVMITVFAMMRDKPPPVASAKLPPVQMVSSASPRPSSAAPTTTADQPVVVSVVGLVHKPGLATLQPGARIADAVAAAGGTLDGADVIGLNMAQRVADGEQIVVGVAPARGEPTKLGSAVTPASGGPSSSSSAAPSATGKPTGKPTSGPLDLNTATADQLDALPGVGPVTAAAIIAWRDANGKFSNVEQLGDVDGIGPARLEKLRSMVRV